MNEWTHTLFKMSNNPLFRFWSVLGLFICWSVFSPVCVNGNHLRCPEVRWASSEPRPSCEWGGCSPRERWCDSQSEHGWTGSLMEPLLQRTQPSLQDWSSWVQENQQREDSGWIRPQPLLWMWGFTWTHSVLLSLSSRGRWWLLHSGGSQRPAGWPARARTRGRPAGPQRPRWSSPCSHSLRTRQRSGLCTTAV